MADILIDTESGPSTPASGKGVIFVDSTTKKLGMLDDGGIVQGILSRNSATASQGAGFASDTYVTNSGLLIPSFGMKAGMLFRWIITGSKTAASTAAPVYTIRSGSNQSTADTSRLALTTAAQTAVADNGTLFITAQVRNVSASGVIAGAASWAKTQTGSIGFGGSIDGVSASFDNSAMAGLYVGLSINGGASAAWTLTSCHAELIG
jgi:hypothetical protein